MDDNSFWQLIKNNDDVFKNLEDEIRDLLLEFGTSVPCNRFDIGNVIELIIYTFLTKIGLVVIKLPNAKRVDLDIKDYKKISIKYSSTGDITLHNSNSSINKDEKMTDLILLTPIKMYLITNTSLNKYNIDLTKYLVNKGDSLKLKRSILTEMDKQEYPHNININIVVDKKKCKNRLCYELFYIAYKEDYNKRNSTI